MTGILIWLRKLLWIWRCKKFLKFSFNFFSIYKDALSFEKVMSEHKALVVAYTRKFYELFNSYVGKSDIFKIINCCKK